MDWSQCLYLAILLIGAGAGICARQWVIVIVMVMNFGITSYLSHDHISIAVTDVLCVVILFIATSGSRGASIALLFAIMVPFYTLKLPAYITFTIVDIIAYTQIIIMGSGGFGTLVRHLHTATIGLLRVSNISHGVRRTWLKRHVDPYIELDKT